MLNWKLAPSKVKSKVIYILMLKNVTEVWDSYHLLIHGAETQCFLTMAVWQCYVNVNKF